MTPDQIAAVRHLIRPLDRVASTLEALILHGDPGTPDTLRTWWRALQDEMRALEELIGDAEVDDA